LYFVKIIFFCWVVNPMPSPSNPGGSMFFCQGFLPQLAGPNIKALGTCSPPLHDSAIYTLHGHACMRFRKNTRLFLCFVSTHPSTRCVSKGPHTTPLDTTILFLPDQKHLNMQSFNWITI
jgi:hypothetical protein